MRVVCLLFLLVFVAVVGVFAYQNQTAVTLTFWDRTLTVHVALVVGAAYLLGMLSGWTVVGLLRRSVDTVMTAPPGTGPHVVRG